MTEDTIAAIATPIGESGLAVLRISGPNGLTIVDRLFVGKAPLSTATSHTVHYGHIVRAQQVIDEVLVTVMKAPRTFTREDVVEISCHGGLLPAKTILDALLEAGVRLALPGEFTRRAFLNGRIDLAQAEAVADLIGSRTGMALAAANEQLAGKLSQRINDLRDRLMRVLAHIEAHIDFPDEDIPAATRSGLLETMRHDLDLIEALLRTAPEGQLLRRGIRAAIVGPPNAGKSSLLNQLLGHDRAIVSPIPGTTRDTIEETASIRGIPIIFVDTAGLREARDEIEVEGIRRSHQTISKAELILQVIDASQPIGEDDAKGLAELKDRKRIVVLNKSDLVPQFQPPGDLAARSVVVSCKTGEGIERLKDEIRSIVWAGEIRSEMLHVMINSRHEDALRRGKTGLQAALEALSRNQTLEVVAMELRIALSAVGEIVGKTTTEDLLDSIFSQFCIGK